MAIKFHLIPSLITAAKNRYVARIISHRVLDVKALVAEILRRGTTLTEADILAVLSITFEVIADEVAEGNSVNLPVVNIRPGLKGYFEDANDTFDRKRHTTHAAISAGMLLRKKMAEPNVEKVDKAEKAPLITTYTDLKSDPSEQAATPGGIARITGSELKFNQENELEGIFFIDKKGRETRVNLLETRSNGKLVFENPASLATGQYLLEVRRIYGVANPVLRTATFRKSIIVR